MWKKVWILSALALVLCIPVGGHAADDERMQQLEQQLQAMQNAMSSMQGELESLRAEQKQEQEREAEQTRRQDVLAEEVDNLRTSLTLPDFEPLTMEDSIYGLGPAASKIYGVEQGLSIGGYGEAFYRKDVSDKTRSDRDTTDYLRFVLYAGYKFTDRNHPQHRIGVRARLDQRWRLRCRSSSPYIDFLMWDWANFRAGMLLAPLGIVKRVARARVLQRRGAARG